jgi:hypothetical protein
MKGRISAVMAGLFLAVMLVLVPGMAAANTAMGSPDLTVDWTQQFQNDFAGTNTMYFWMDTVPSPATQAIFTGVTFGGGHSAWQTFSLMSMAAAIYGPATGANTGGIYMSFSDPSSVPFSFEWAEVAWSGATYELKGSGTAVWSGGGWGSKSDFTHSADINPVPLPPSVWLLGSGLLGLVGLKKKSWFLGKSRA